MTNINILNHIKGYGLTSNEIFELLKMPKYHEKLETTIKGNSIFFKGNNIDFYITFFKEHYVIIRKYSDYTSYEFRTNSDVTTQKITEYYIDDEKITFTQNYQTETPEELIRAITLGPRHSNRVKYKRNIYTDEEFNKVVHSLITVSTDL